MTTLKISDGLVKDDVLVVGLVSTNAKGGIAIETGDLAIDSKTLLASLVEMGATGAADEIVFLAHMFFTNSKAQQKQNTRQPLKVRLFFQRA